jgi:D-3-phosphoglycerate dehydrogenase
MKPTWSILLTHTEDDFRLNYESDALRALAEFGDVRQNPLGHHLTSAELLTHAAGCQVIITEGKATIDSAVSNNLPDLLAVIRVGVELRKIDVGAASAAGVLVLNTPGEYVAPVVELTLGFMVCLARDIVNRAHGLRQRQPVWSRMGSQLKGHVLGIVGFGDIGRELAQAARALGMRVWFADPYVGPQEVAEKMELRELLAAADFVSVQAKWTPETEGMFDEAAFRLMKPTAYLVNTSRGALVNEPALERALREGWIAGAALDVFTNEPEILGNRLIDLPNVIATPHIGGFSPEVRWVQAWRTIDIVRDLKAGLIPAAAVNTTSIQRPRLLRR